MRQNRKRSGIAAIEFALVITPSLVLLFSVIVVGLQLSQQVRASQVVRDTGSMYGRGINFTQSINQQVVVRLAQGLGLQQTGGTAVVILSQVTWLPQATCTAASLNPCNGDSHVITQRLTIGNTSVSPGRLGSPTGMDANGNVTNYMTNSTAVASFPFGQLTTGEIAYVTESYFQTPSFSLPGFSTSPGVYAMAIY
jgi:Flp pilus assembly protein TadG